MQGAAGDQLLRLEEEKEHIKEENLSQMSVLLGPFVRAQQGMEMW